MTHFPAEPSALPSASLRAATYVALPLPGAPHRAILAVLVSRPGVTGARRTRVGWGRVAPCPSVPTAGHEPLPRRLSVSSLVRANGSGSAGSVSSPSGSPTTAP